MRSTEPDQTIRDAEIHSSTKKKKKKGVKDFAAAAGIRFFPTANIYNQWRERRRIRKQEYI